MGQAKMRELERAARQLGVTSTTLRQHGWKTASPARVKAAGGNPPDWLAAARERRQGKRRRRDRVSTAARLGIQTAREAEDRLRRELADALVASVHEVRFQELKHAVTGADIDAIDARWAPEVRRAKREASQLAGELTPEQVRARIARERDASCAAARYRAGQLLRRALGG
jgi:hypothetical protein